MELVGSPLTFFSTVTVLILALAILGLLFCCFSCLSHVFHYMGATTAVYPVEDLESLPALGSVSAEELASLPTFSYDASQVDAGDCPVCLSPFEEAHLARSLPGCGHVFHAKCIDAWLRYKPTCPLCRSLVRPERVALRLPPLTVPPWEEPSSSPSSSSSSLSWSSSSSSGEVRIDMTWLSVREELALVETEVQQVLRRIVMMRRGEHGGAE